jgi:hypothetical protein
VDWAITNPPFTLADRFVERALETSRVGCAITVKSAFFEGIGRYEQLSRDKPPALVQAIYELGLWILAAFGGSFIALVANFVFRGGLIKMMRAMTLFFAFVFTVYAIGPSLETRYWPVVSKLGVLSIRETAAGHTEIKAGLRKLRDCEYIGLVWFLGSRPDNFQRVSVILQREARDTSSPSRPIGYQKAGPSILGMSPPT